MDTIKREPTTVGEMLTEEFLKTSGYESRVFWSEAGDVP
ncbi:Uncharacterised protein [Salmonella enterica subsp. indica]|uniref:Uncharacterized protein n=1 Tax=Salmonella enterica subsp. indica TaxID=59207 RepID=A0A379YQQ1_SALER|nr:Uncharacterised protein [Salmonella enterica subsp. indica]